MGQRNITQFNLMQKLADEIAQHCEFSPNAALRVNSIARQICGLECRMIRLTGRKSKLSAKEGIIYIDDRCAWQEYALLVAEEISRWLLHEEIGAREWRQNQSLLRKLRQVLGSVKTRKKKEKAILQEREARAFAQCLLVPRMKLLQYAGQFSAIDTAAVQLLAQAFGAPLDLTLSRIVKLSDYRAWSGPPLIESSLENRERALHDTWLEQARYSRRFGKSKAETPPEDAAAPAPAYAYSIQMPLQLA